MPASASSSTRVDVLGVHVSAINIPIAVKTVGEWIATKHQSYICVTGVHGVMECQTDENLLRIHNQSGLTTPDGMPLVWASRRAGVKDVSRVYGPDLVEAVLSSDYASGLRVYLYGGNDGVADELATVLETRFPGVQCVGTHCPPFRQLTSEEIAAVTRDINEAQPDIVLVGLSTPKQELWMDSMRDALDAPVLMGVGAVFDFFTGRVAQAPKWVQRAGLEWAYRLGREPRRLWRRYGSIVPRFLFASLRRSPKIVSIDDR